MSTRQRTIAPHERGFSLVEVLIAVTIIVLMGGVVAYNVFPELFRSQRDRASIDIENISTAIRMHLARESRLPNDGEFPQVLLEGSKKHSEPYLDPSKAKDGQLLDPWGNPYVYKKLSGTNFELLSYGMDGAPGGEKDDADISNKTEN